MITGMGTAFDCHVMQSDADANKVIELFEVAMRAGYHPLEVEQKIWQQSGVDPTSLTDFDKQRIELKVNEIWDMNKNRGRRPF